MNTLNPHVSRKVEETQKFKIEQVNRLLCEKKKDIQNLGKI